MNRHSKRLLCLIMTVAVLFSVLALAASAGVSDYVSRLASFQLSDTETVRAIVVLEGDAVSDLHVDPQSAAATKLERTLLSAQEKFLRKLDSGRKPAYQYTELFNGFAMDMTVAELKQVERMHGVKAVYIANTYSIPEYEVVTGEDLDAIYASQMTGATMLNQVVGATGDGVVVAVIDTGVNLSHEVLQPNALMQNPALDQATVEGIDTLGKGQYINAKIPFSYDYKDRDNDCTDQNGHGSHVSGIIGGYRTVEDEVVFSGAAPAVQILGMKVFGATGGTSSDIYFAALEDAYRLGADVINMSLGSPSGFTYDDSLETELYGNIYQKLDEAGIVVFCSAGNDTNLSEGAMNLPALFEQLAYVRTDLVDYGVVGTPSTYPWNTSVASADNMAFPIDGISLDGVHFHPGADSQEETALGFVKNLEGKSFEFLYLDSIGAEADYEGIDVAGKLIAVNRGEISFQDKIDIAAAHGAIGCIVVDNVVGKMINMSLENVTIPSMSLVLSARANLLALSGQTVTLSTGEAIYNNPEAGIMSSFSSWGTTTDLAFKPQITGIGGMVYSCVNGASDAYELMSGTSMACPNVVGSFAAMLQWMRMLYPTLDKHALSVLTENLLLSTAMVLGNGQAFYSPRQQGAGLANVVNAVLAPAYITNANQSLGYDKEGTGKLEVTYHVVSLSRIRRSFIWSRIW